MTTDSDTELTLDQALQQSISLHQAGQLQQADVIYRAILEAQPLHPVANHNLGLIALAWQKPDDALRFLKVALDANPQQGQFWLSYVDALVGTGRVAQARSVLELARKQGFSGPVVDAMAKRIADVPQLPVGGAERLKHAKRLALQIKNLLIQASSNHQAGQFSETDRLCRQVLALDPRNAEAHHLLAIIAFKTGRLELAWAMASTAIELNASVAEYHCTLGSVLVEQDRLSEAVACFERSLALKPLFPEALGNLGSALVEQGKLDEGAACYLRSLVWRPNESSVIFDLANVFLSQGKLNEAIERLEQAVTIEPAFVEAWLNLGNVVGAQGMLLRAHSCFERALAVKPDFVDALLARGQLFLNTGELLEAQACFERALFIKPDFAEALLPMGVMLTRQGKLAEATIAYERALNIEPEWCEVLLNLGNVLRDQGHLDSACNRYEQAIAIRPEFNLLHNNLLLTMLYWESATPSEQFAAQLRYAQCIEAPLKLHLRAHKNQRNADRRLKVGYVSADFRNHVITYFIEPIFASHDKSTVEVYCYCNNLRDSVTDNLARSVPHWLDCVGMTDDQLAERIRADGIDILVDLSGHTAGNRLSVFARKPAPVQVTWLGFAGTTGLSAMDYRITDAYMDPLGLTERYHTETLIRLPGTNAAYQPEAGCPPVNELPALASGQIVFASLNNLIKINQTVVNLWSQILTAVPHSRLMLGNVTDESVAKRMTDMFAQAGLAAERLILKPRMSSLDYLALHHQIDIALDPFPYNGGTTSMHSVWMGVPVVTLAGQHTISRVGVAVMSRAGLQEFIAQSEEGYLQLAVRMAQDLPALNKVRQSLRARMVGDDNNLGITRHLEAAYRGMWNSWCSVK